MDRRLLRDSPYGGRNVSSELKNPPQPNWGEKRAADEAEAPADRRLFARDCGIRIRQTRERLRVGLGQSRPAIKFDQSDKKMS